MKSQLAPLQTSVAKSGVGVVQGAHTPAHDFVPALQVISHVNEALLHEAVPRGSVGQAVHEVPQLPVETSGLHRLPQG